MAEEWSKPGWNYRESTVDYAEAQTEKEWDEEAFIEVVPEMERILEEDEGVSYESYQYLTEKFDQRTNYD